MSKKNKALFSIDQGVKTVNNSDDHLADEHVAQYIKKQNLISNIVQTRFGKILFEKRLLKHKDIIPQQDELFNNLFSERLDKVDSHYIDTLFLLYSKRQNKNKNVDELCIRKIYDITAKKLQKDNLDISNIQVIVDHATDDYDEISLKLSEYLNLLENIRMEFKKQNSNYESKAKDELPHFGEEELIYTDYQANFLADEIRAKKIAICSKEYDELLASGDLQADFSSLCHAFYLIFRGEKQISGLKELMDADMKKELYIDEIFLDHLEKNQVQRKPLSVECLLMIFEKLLKENNHMIHLRDMYDIS